jgi:hypothetical protein
MSDIDISHMGDDLNEDPVQEQDVVDTSHTRMTDNLDNATIADQLLVQFFIIANVIAIAMVHEAYDRAASYPNHNALIQAAALAVLNAPSAYHALINPVARVAFVTPLAFTAVAVCIATFTLTFVRDDEILYAAMYTTAAVGSSYFAYKSFHSSYNALGNAFAPAG